ncbi:MAG: hypothetical protein KDC98_19665 [Planctomycetes bacterium]|nr:hypothetical protein [Planctomycetota bacterium]
MSTATAEPKHAAPGAPEVPQPLDPEHDIDAKSATWWVLGGTIVLFVSLWVMVPIFVRVQEEEKQKKTSPDLELQEVRDEQTDFLDGTTNPKRKSIDQAMAEALRK